MAWKRKNDHVAMARNAGTTFEDDRGGGNAHYEDGGGPEGTLIETPDDPGGGLDSNHIANLIGELLA